MSTTQTAYHASDESLMRYLAVLALLLCAFPTTAQNQVKAGPTADHFEIGRHTFFDFGPPFDYYELLFVQPAEQGSTVERILLTPHGMSCAIPAKIETSVASLNESVFDLFGKTNPCSIPEKDLRKERRRCKHCPTFSGVNVRMRIQCGDATRVIRSDILDKDMFDPAPHTPEHTSWTMHLLQRLDAALGPGVWEKPTFDSSVDDQRSNTAVDSAAFQQIDSGAYDLLFPQGREKLSELYRPTQVPQMQPTVRLVSSAPSAPLEFPLPPYPPLAKVTHIEGTVSFDLHLNSDSSSSPPILAMGHPFLERAVEGEISRWKFPKEAANSEVHVTIEFALNCKSDSK